MAGKFRLEIVVVDGRWEGDRTVDPSADSRPTSLPGDADGVVDFAAAGRERAGGNYT